MVALAQSFGGEKRQSITVYSYTMDKIMQYHLKVDSNKLTLCIINLKVTNQNHIIKCIFVKSTNQITCNYKIIDNYSKLRQKGVKANKTHRTENKEEIKKKFNKSV